MRRRSSQYKRLQRVRGAGSRAEKLVGKWTVEGALKPGKVQYRSESASDAGRYIESMTQRFVRVREGGCVGICRGHGASRESRWYRRFKILTCPCDMRGQVFCLDFWEYRRTCNGRGYYKEMIRRQFFDSISRTDKSKVFIQNHCEGVNDMIKEAIVKIVSKEDLTYEEAYTVMNEIMSGETTPTQNAAFLAALSTKSARAETTDEIAGCAAAMRAHATKVVTDMDVFEIVGTGGDNAQSFNISTTSALVAAAGGMKVAKHGNRAASSLCGTADCLEALGVNINQSPARCVELLKEVGMCFFFAQKYHTSMKYVGPIRKELGFRTVFNILGPLTNPASPSMQLLGVYDGYLAEPLARVLTSLGVKRGMVVYGQDKLDEISLSSPTTICEIQDGWYKSYTIAPEDFGFTRCGKEELKGGTPEENARITRKILQGEKSHKRNAVLLNAGAALYIGGKAATMEGGIDLAAELIDSGRALDTLEKFVEASNQPEE